MNKDNYNIDLYAGIDTLEVSTPTYLTEAYEFITHDNTRRVTNGEADLPKYKYRFNPDKTHLDTSTFTGYYLALERMMTTTAVINPVKTRIDYRFDCYESQYGDAFKLNKLLVLLIAERYKIKNRYQCIDMLTGELKTLCIKNKYIEAEAYNKELEEPESYIKWRLELRSKALYDDTDEATKELRELDKWFVRLADSTTTSNFNSLIYGLNDNLMQRYSEHKAKGEIATVSEFIVKYADFIFCTRQLVDLFARIGYKRPEKQASSFRKTHKIEFFSLKDVRTYVLNIRDSAARFDDVTKNQNYPNVG